MRLQPSFHQPNLKSARSSVKIPLKRSRQQQCRYIKFRRWPAETFSPPIDQINVSRVKRVFACRFVPGHGPASGSRRARRSRERMSERASPRHRESVRERRTERSARSVRRQQDRKREEATSTWNCVISDARSRPNLPTSSYTFQSDRSFSTNRYIHVHRKRLVSFLAFHFPLLPRDYDASSCLGKPPRRVCTFSVSSFSAFLSFSASD